MSLLSHWRRPDKVVVYRAADGFRWRRVAPNGRLVEDSGEAYTRREHALRAAIRNHPTLTVEITPKVPRGT